MELLNIYKKIGFSPISASLTEKLNDKGEPKKILKPFIKGWANEQIYNEKNLFEQMNGLFLVMGVKLDDGNFLLGFDVDNKETKNDCKNGFTKWNDLIKENNFIIDTPYATTGNNGLHILFKITEQDFINTSLSMNITDLMIDKQKYTIDIKCKGGCLITEPTIYKSIDGTIKEYKWVVRPTTTDKIQFLPEFLKDIFLKYHIKEDIELIKSNKPLNKNLKDFNYPKIEITEEDYKLIKLIPKNNFNELVLWKKMIWIFKSLNLPFEEFVKLSSESPKFNGIQDCWNWWKCCKNTTDKINIGLIHAIVKKENPEEYFKLNFQYINEDDVKENIIEMNKLYLLDLDNDNLDKKDDHLTNLINKFFTEDYYKSFNLKSPYDTGKTKLIQKVIKKFKPERILWLSYRKTLTNDILGSFGEEFDFKDYQDGDYNADKIIIQLESILKIEGVVFEGVEQIPSYDLVIIDEVESILAQFNSTTFKGLSKESFEYIEGILYNSKKIITLDGDLGQRTYKYIKSFGKCLNIVNTVKKNQKIFNITDDYNLYLGSIKKDILNGLKIVIVSMSSKKCNDLRDFIISVKKDLNILVYTGSSSDYLKNELKNVLENWQKADVLIYSPTIEAGVNFDIPHFNKIYGLICDKSTTPRAFLQMLARVRKTTDNNILIFNEAFKYNKLMINQYYNYNEVKTLLISFEDIKITNDIKLIDGKMCKISELKPYDVNYIYNKLEHLNSNKYYFLSYLMMAMTNKGHIVKINNKTKEQKDEEKFLLNDLIEKGLIEEDEEKSSNKNDILTTDDINDEDYEKLMKKQRASNATEEEKMLIKKHSYKKKLGVDRLSEDLLDGFLFKERIDRFIYIIDEKNIPEYADNQTKEHRERVRLLKRTVEDLGFKNIFDKTAEISTEQLKENINIILQKNPIFTDFKGTKILFNIQKNKEIKTERQFLFFFNNLLNDYCLKIDSSRKRNGKKVDTIYNIIELDGANELLDYKIKRGMKINDTDKIRPNPESKMWLDLVDLNNLNKEEPVIKNKIVKITKWLGNDDENNFIIEPKKIIKIKVKKCVGCNKIMTQCECVKISF